MDFPPHWDLIKNDRAVIRDQGDATWLRWVRSVLMLSNRVCLEEPPHPVVRRRLRPSGKGRHLLAGETNRQGAVTNPSGPPPGEGMGVPPAVRRQYARCLTPQGAANFLRLLHDPSFFVNPSSQKLSRFAVFILTLFASESVKITTSCQSVFIFLFTRLTYI